MGLHRVGHDWSDLAAAAAAREKLTLHSWKFIIHKPAFKWMTEHGFFLQMVHSFYKFFHAVWISSFSGVVILSDLLKMFM